MLVSKINYVLHRRRAYPLSLLAFWHRYHTDLYIIPNFINL